ncbi:LCP family protein [Streptomyces sp. MUM 203J]|uniref:LCP family protein n=1 Tax=Streptomyces sp. MUM 203J TaxID=2791990 RepID=UPI001F04C3C2|nr:LCP family protein [Streptomyces sp. MUM 203J]MCH0538424.1 LCP family protein [Streptomyces sp. MUM 203J]
MSDTTEQRAGGRTSRKRSRRAAGRGKRRGLRIAGLGLAVLVLGGAGAAWWTYRELDSNINSVDINQALGDNRPEKAPTALAATNLLVLGSDSRAGDNAALDAGKVGGARSDTALVVHISADRSRAVAVSIPRDTLVDRPVCTDASGGETGAASRVMFNSVYTTGGSACVVKTVEKMSGVRIDHLMEIDFAGFKELVDELGGVTVDVKEPIRDTKGGFTLDPGTHRLNGTDSLKFVRTRYGYRDGSDLGRIGLQQQFMMALLKEVKQQDLLGSPAKAYRIAQSATKALTTDEELASLTALAEFGREMQGIDPSTMETVMLPVAYDKADPNRVVAAEPQAGALWRALREDASIPESATKSPATAR